MWLHWCPLVYISSSLSFPVMTSCKIGIIIKLIKVFFSYLFSIYLFITVPPYNNINNRINKKIRIKWMGSVSGSWFPRLGIDWIQQHKYSVCNSNMKPSQNLEKVQMLLHVTHITERDTKVSNAIFGLLTKIIIRRRRWVGRNTAHYCLQSWHLCTCCGLIFLSNQCNFYFPLCTVFISPYQNLRRREIKIKQVWKFEPQHYKWICYSCNVALFLVKEQIIYKQIQCIDRLPVERIQKEQATTRLIILPKVNYNVWLTLFFKF